MGFGEARQTHPRQLMLHGLGTHPVCELVAVADSYDPAPLHSNPVHLGLLWIESHEIAEEYSVRVGRVGAAGRPTQAA
jgi:hypothetical protein